MEFHVAKSRIPFSTTSGGCFKDANIRKYLKGWRYSLLFQVTYAIALTLKNVRV